MSGLLFSANPRPLRWMMRTVPLSFRTSANNGVVWLPSNARDTGLDSAALAAWVATHTAAPKEAEVSSGSGSGAAGGAAGRRDTAEMWASKALEGDADGSRHAKFMKLMGASKKGGATAAAPTAGRPKQSSTDLLDGLARQHEMARAQTYARRGAGLQ